MSNPTDLKYVKSHEWVRIEGEEAVVGISQFAQEALGDITYVEIPQVDDEVEAGSECGSLESVKAASDLISPVSGKVIAINEELENAPEIINQDPYGKGWIYRVKLSGLPDDLLDAAVYEAVCAEESH
ncbi:MAG: glycine cleavage system protein GcvH [Desulfovibrionaceae bacterium]|nr:glycine cleavage system protein GcvH [Desulfovibrionaceae bacterium]